MAKLFITVAGRSFQLGETSTEAEAFDMAKSIGSGGHPIELDGKVFLPAAAVANGIFEVKDK